ncbi:MAG: hypothetical protein WC184_11130 [Acidimicrobiia bacterium]
MGRLRFLRRTTSLIVILLAIATSPEIASADFSNNQEESNVSSNGTTVRVEIILDSNGVLRPVGTPGASSNPTYSECEFTLVEIPTWFEALDAIGEPTSPDAIPYWLLCGTATVDAFWVSPQDLVDYDSIAWAEADRYVREVLAPTLNIEVNPAGYSITGIPSWFWVDGWNGAPIFTSVSAPFGATVDVSLQLIDVEWDFGDGTTPWRGDLGLAYPSESPVQHNFERRSTSKESPDGTFEVSATVSIAPSYRLNGGGEIALSPNLTANVQVPLVVRQLQAVLR